MARTKQLMKLSWTKHLASNVLHVALEPVDSNISAISTIFDYIPGQFITLHFIKNGVEIKRSYSIANAPDQNSQYIEFAISYLPEGIASEEIFHMSPGEQVEISGPAGRLVLLDEHPKRYVLVATGTGVTPYRSMLNKITEITAKHDTKFLLLFGIRTPEECLYGEEFLDFKKNNSNFDVHFYYSRELPKLDSNQNTDHIHTGYVQTGFNEQLLNPVTDMIYLCGNPNMIDEAYALLLEKGFTAKTVRREKYISSK
ncbi:MAG: ferredoxin--NADP reductase [Gammaproteobacteria bacterium]|nr:ferredoxin--NADP reductase [Gammaproteobacteria bacterium]